MFFLTGRFLRSSGWTQLDLDLEQKYPKIEHFTVFLRLLSFASRHNAAQIIGLSQRIRLAGAIPGLSRK